MPLLRFELVEGRSDEQLTALLDASHRAMVSAFSVPESDRYQVVTQHPSSELVIRDTGLGLTRTSHVVVLQVFTRRRSPGQKQRFYELLCAELQEHCGISSDDVMVVLIENDDVDWSFGRGRAQFITGEL